MSNVPQILTCAQKYDSWEYGQIATKDSKGDRKYHDSLGDNGVQEIDCTSLMYEAVNGAGYDIEYCSTAQYQKITPLFP